MKFKQFAIALAGLLLISSVCAESHQNTEAQAGKPRLPFVKTPADVEALTHLSAEEKVWALENLKKIPLSDGWSLMGSDPELQAFMHLMERQGGALLEGDFQIIPFGPMNLISLEVFRRSGNDYEQALFNALTAAEIGQFKLGNEAYMKLGMLESPDSMIWSEEERLAIKFTDAVLDNEMTDELFEQARTAWGEQKLLRHFYWLSYVKTWSMLCNMLNLRFTPEMLTPPMKNGVPPELIQKIVAPHQQTRADLKTLWNTSVQEIKIRPPSPQDHANAPSEAEKSN